VHWPKISERVCLASWRFFLEDPLYERQFNVPMKQLWATGLRWDCTSRGRGRRTSRACRAVARASADTWRAGTAVARLPHLHIEIFHVALLRHVRSCKRWSQRSLRARQRSKQKTRHTRTPPPSQPTGPLNGPFQALILQQNALVSQRGHRQGAVLCAWERRMLA
jgi:hypothetical protein